MLLSLVFSRFIPLGYKSGYIDESATGVTCEGYLAPIQESYHIYRGQLSDFMAIKTDMTAQEAMKSSGCDTDPIEAKLYL